MSEKKWVNNRKKKKKRKALQSLKLEKPLVIKIFSGHKKLRKLL